MSTTWAGRPAVSSRRGGPDARAARPATTGTRVRTPAMGRALPARVPSLGGDTPVTTPDRPLGRFSHKSITPSPRRQPSIPLEASWHIAERAVYAISLYCACRSRADRLIVYCGRWSSDYVRTSRMKYASLPRVPCQPLGPLDSSNQLPQTASRSVSSSSSCSTMPLLIHLRSRTLFIVQHVEPRWPNQLLTLFLVISCRDVVANVCMGVLSMHVCFCVPIVRPCRRQKWFIRV
jgi:hypothetical protein